METLSTDVLALTSVKSRVILEGRVTTPEITFNGTVDGEPFSHTVSGWSMIRELPDIERRLANGESVSIDLATLRGVE